VMVMKHGRYVSCADEEAGTSVPIHMPFIVSKLWGINTHGHITEGLLMEAVGSSSQKFTNDVWRIRAGFHCNVRR
jgi:hypothetical protein